jgi:PAS domain S-box-containing protein
MKTDHSKAVDDALASLEPAGGDPGADGKLRQVDERSPRPQGRQPGRASPTTPNEFTQRDLFSAVKASQAISGQIVFDDLVVTLMRVVLEESGAQAGRLLLVRDNNLALAAEASVEARTGRVSVQRESGAPGQRVPGAILDQVRRSHEKLLLDDLAQASPFAADPYFRHKQPGSVLCQPILRQDALLGVLYLENGRATHAFTPNRLAVLDMLAAQAAISLENAQLYADLRAREARIRRLVESNIIGIFFWDTHGAICEANGALLQMLGYTHDELLNGKIRWTDLTPRQYRAADLRAIDELAHSGGCTPYEKEFIRKDGARVPVLIGAAFFEQSHDTGVAFVLDLSERKRAEQALRDSEEQWRAVFDHNPTMYFMLDPDGTIVAVNPVGAVQLGYTVDELVGQSVLNVFHAADRDFIKASVAVVLAHPDQTTSWEVRKIRKNGSMLWVRETVKVMPRANNRPLVLVVCEDITARREAQEELRRSEAFLAEGQRISHTGSWGWHLASGKLVWSEEHYRIFGVEPGTPVTFALFLSRVDPADRPCVEKRLDEAVRARSGFDFEFRIVLEDGSVKHLQGIGRPVRARGGELEEFIGTTMDITERKRADDALRKAHEELEQRVRERTRDLERSNEQLAREVAERTRAELVLAQRSQELVRSNAELEQMAYVASHDLQEPLRMVASYLQLLEQRYGGRLDADAHEFIGFAVDGAKRLQTLIDDLLAYSRVGTRARPLVPTDCSEVMETAQRALRVAIGESGARIECGPLPVVMGDAAQLTQLFQNLLANAIKFHGQAPPRITVRAEPDDGFWRFAVEDKGIGIAPEYFGRIFEMFQRLHSRSKYPGTGMGLAICRKIVERHGGRIWVEAAEQGTVFKFTLPAASGGGHG